MLLPLCQLIVTQLFLTVVPDQCSEVVPSNIAAAIPSNVAAVIMITNVAGAAVVRCNSAASQLY